MAKKIEGKLTAHVYLGVACNLGIHGQCKKGDVILLSEQETAYVGGDKNFRVATEKEIKAAEVVVPEAPEEGEDQKEEATEDDLRKSIEESLSTKEKLLDYASEHGIKGVKPTDKKSEIVDKIVASLK